MPSNGAYAGQAKTALGQVLAGELGEHVAFIRPVKAFQVSAAPSFRLITRVLLQMLWRRRVVRVEILQAGHVERPDVAPDRGRQESSAQVGVYAGHI
jgi:hypothetical protein